MNKIMFHSFLFITLIISALWSNLVNADALNNLALASNPKSAKAQTPLVIPEAPDIDAKAYVLMDANSGQIIAQKNMNDRLAPASLTKLMTLYVTFKALSTSQIKLSDEVLVSKNAWKTGGSRMFINPGTQVSIENLIEGITIASGNDATVAIAEYIAGTEQSFVSLMNQEAKRLGMDNTHFDDVNGLPANDHYSTAHDLAILTRAIIRDYPEYYHYFSAKYLTYNKIKQPNRNRLLWQDPSVDGLKTGHTDAAGFCLIASAKRNNMRLISVVLGAPNEHERGDFSESLLNYGFRFYQTYDIYHANNRITSSRAWYGENKEVELGVDRDLTITIPRGAYDQLQAKVSVAHELTAPIKKGTVVGELKIMLGDNLIANRPLVTLSDDAEGGILIKIRDSASKTVKRIF